MGISSPQEHRCPVRGCTVRVSWDKLMCRRHWLLVPGPLARAVYREWRDGNPTSNHAVAAGQAVEAVNRRLSGAWPAP